MSWPIDERKVNKMRIQANDIRELCLRYQTYKFEDCAERDYDAKARDAAFRDFCGYAENIDLDLAEAISLALDYNSRYEELLSMGSEYIEIERRA